MTWWNKLILKGTESMEESVVISVEGKQKFLGEEPQIVQIVTDGIMSGWATWFTSVMRSRK